MVAPIALYPDALLAQVLMASTYPLEVVSAARWVQANPRVTGKALEDAMQKQPWDPSVKSLTAVPTVLARMNDRIEWTQALGDAFLAQRADVLAAVQALRAKALAQGTLASSDEQRVVVEKQTIVIEPASSTVVYVPIYDPTVVYGPWWHPAYVPYVWYPPGYVRAPGVAFAAGVVVGAALWGGCNWRDLDVDVNVNHYNRFNRTTITSVRWEHDAAHRKGVAYRDPALAQRYGRSRVAVADRRDAQSPAAAHKPAGSPAARDATATRPAARDAAPPVQGRDRPGGDRDGPAGRPGRPGRD